ncbi:hypothetical protein ACFFX1_10810 [Dactylosporangium sucinum]|uniref:Uncharacterized protein n=1 Tax=Dactylosporangium sucinum TaxID=1424081 RepID=A0A917THD0_9ACTN|nr:hypothetical protein [Dactylosporangium sucinum]GGM22987.1 hypothetical protein GCM10007977_025190 [Dactylosporangium sucinum]
MPPKARRRIELPVMQWRSNGWAVEKRKGVADAYEVLHDRHLVARVVVTRAGWKWTARDHRSRAALWRRPWMWSEQLYPGWQEAVAGYAAVYRRLAVGRGAELPGDWRPNSMLTTRPWTPRPVHDTFDELTEEPTEGTGA